MTRLCTLLVMCLSVGCSSSDYTLFDSGFARGSDEVRDEPFFAVWRGFEHAWTHNHRWNRFGNWTAPRETCSDGLTCWGAHHAAASGTSEDRADVTTELTLVEQRDLGFVQIEDRDVFPLEFKRQSWKRSRRVEIPLYDLPDAQASALRDRELVGFFNGFDIGALEGSKAAKPIDFMIEITNVSYDPDFDAIFIDWSSYLQMGCSTEECAPKKKAEYKVDVQLAVVAADEAIASPRRDIAHLYGWDAPPHFLRLGHGKNREAQELTPNPVREVLPPTAQSGGAVQTSVPVFDRLSMHLFHWDTSVKKSDQHMVTWHSTVEVTEDEDFNPVLQTDLMFKNWVPGMRVFQFFAYEDIGAANMEAGVRLLDFDAGSVVPTEWNTVHSWSGRGLPAFGDDAVSSTIPEREAL